MTVYTVSKHLPTKYFLTRKGKRGEESNVTDKLSTQVVKLGT